MDTTIFPRKRTIAELPLHASTPITLHSAERIREVDSLDVRRRNRLGVEHVLAADSPSRNTVFHAKAESLLRAPAASQRRPS